MKGVAFLADCKLGDISGSAPCQVDLSWFTSVVPFLASCLQTRFVEGISSLSKQLEVVPEAYRNLVKSLDWKKEESQK